MRYDLDALKATLPNYLQKIGVEIVRDTGSKLVARCPLHDDSNPSFTAEVKGGVWLWFCHPCQRGGTVIDLHAAIHGVRPDHFECLQGLSKLMGVGEFDGLSTARRDQSRRSHQRSSKDPAEESHTKLTARLQEARGGLLAPYHSKGWRADLWHQSPFLIDMKPGEQAHAMLARLFAPEAILWMGTPYDSGEPRYALNFRATRDWLTLDRLPPRLAAGVFRMGSHSRAEASVLARPFVVIESDELIGHKPRTAEERAENRELCAALLSFLRSRLKMSLRAVIDTGGKSLHGWFDRPTPEGMNALRTLLHGFAIDAAVFDRCSSNPLRAPGCLHEGTGDTARLLYLNPICTE